MIQGPARVCGWWRAAGAFAPAALLVLGLACAARPRTHVIRMVGVAYVPAAVTLGVGDTLVFRNEDPVPHTATSSVFNSGDIAADASWRWVARQKGRYAIRCLYHPNMTATATVQ